MSAKNASTSFFIIIVVTEASTAFESRSKVFVVFPSVVRSVICIVVVVVIIIAIASASLKQTSGLVAMGRSVATSRLVATLEFAVPPLDVLTLVSHLQLVGDTPELVDLKLIKEMISHCR